MKRYLDEVGEDKNEKIINFQRQDLNKEKEIIVKKTNKEEIDEINEILYDILEEDDNLDIIINIDTIVYHFRKYKNIKIGILKSHFVNFYYFLY